VIFRLALEFSDTPRDMDGMTALGLAEAEDLHRRLGKAISEVKRMERARTGGR
jgi:hypothetical protein